MNFDCEYQTRIKAEHIDMYGHVNNAAYLQIMEEARWDWIGRGGGSRKLVLDMGIGPIVVDINVRFSRELKEGELVTIKTAREGAVDRFYYMHHHIFKESGELACRAKYRMVFLDLKQRKIVDPPQVWKDIMMKPAKENHA